MSDPGTGGPGIPESFFELLDEDDGVSRWRSTELTRGPWDPDGQHAGPSSALIARAIERIDGVGGDPEGRTVARLTYEILKPVPIAELELRVELTRPGRSVDMAEAVLAVPGEEPAVRARAWRVRKGEVELPREARREPSTGLPDPSSIERPTPDAFFPTGFDVGYHVGMEYRFVHGGFNEPGDGACWMRMLRPLVAGEEPTPLQRVAIAADTGNGISSRLDYHEYLFINVELSVHLHRMPEGEWIGLDATTSVEPTGVGLSDTALHDERGPIGRADQALFVARR